METKIQINRFTSELGAELDRDKRTMILTEVDIYAVEERDNQDGTHSKIYKAKVVGATDVKQGGEVYRGKSKRSWSKKLRQASWKLGVDYEEELMPQIMANLEQIIETYVYNK